MLDTTGGEAGDDEDSAVGFQVEDDSQDQRGAEQISQIDNAADCARSLDLTCMKCDKRVQSQSISII